MSEVPRAAAAGEDSPAKRAGTAGDPAAASVGAAGCDPAATRMLRGGRAAVPVGRRLRTQAPDAADVGRVGPCGVRTSLRERPALLRRRALLWHGLAEHRLGACLRGIDRRTVTLSTKVGRLLDPETGGTAAGAGGGTYPFTVRYDYSYDGTMRSLEHSMQRLGTNALDIVLIHDVNRRWQGDLLEQRYAEAMQGAYRALDELRAAGAIKAFGVGVNDWSILERFAGDGDFDCFMLAGRYTLLDHTALDTFLPLCERRQIGVLMAAPFNSGILATGARPGATYFYTEAEPAIMERVRRIETVCARHGVAIAAAALQFPLGHPAIASVVTGMRDRAEAAANLAHVRAAIPVAFWAELKHEGLIASAAPLPVRA
ncbi:MAG: aldo/keto reductase [Betaproteobacteria bacterium]|nr:aldo/keto reductase [Betaproteobacteria bacterium]